MWITIFLVNQKTFRLYIAEGNDKNFGRYIRDVIRNQQAHTEGGKKDPCEPLLRRKMQTGGRQQLKNTANPESDMQNTLESTFKQGDCNLLC